MCRSPFRELHQKMYLELTMSSYESCKKKEEKEGKKPLCLMGPVEVYLLSFSLIICLDY